MKTTIRILGSLVVLHGALTTTAVFGQTTFVWTNQNPAHLAGNGDMNVAANYDPNGVPDPMTGPDADGNYGDLILFDGRTTGPLSVTQSGGTTAGLGGQAYPAGLRIRLTVNQTNSVMIYSVLPVSGGLRMNWFAIDPGAGPLILGDGSLNCLDIIDGEIDGQTTGLTNNSTAPAVITPSVRWREAGAGAHPHVFTGTGDWIVNNHMRSANSSAIVVQKLGPGTMTWTGTNVPNANYTDPLGTPITIGGGTLIWKTSDLVGGGAGNPNIVHNGALWKYDAADGGTGRISGTISGTGPIQMNAGSLMLSGQNTISGDWTLSGGTLIAGSTQTAGTSGPLGVGGTISFTGGTLQFSTNNASDYSARFSTVAGQDYRIDTAGQTVTFATGLIGAGNTLTKGGAGKLILAGANSYDGLTTVSGGILAFEGAMTAGGDIIVADGAGLGVTAAGGTVKLQPGTLTLGTSAGVLLEFENLTSTTTPPLAPTSLSSAGAITININSGTFTAIGQSFPLLSWTSGSAPAVALGTVSGAFGNLSTNGNTIQFNVTSAPYFWTGASNGNWDLTTTNWLESGNATHYSDGVFAVFDDSATGPTSVTHVGVAQPASVTIANSSKAYSIVSTGGNCIGGSGGLTKSGGGTLTLSGGANTYTGVTTFKGGTVVVGTLANGNLPSDIGAASSAAGNLVLNGGTLRYTGGGASSDRLFTVGISGGTIDGAGSGPLTLNNPGPIPLAGMLTLRGTADTNTLAGALFNSGGLNKSGTGTWVLSGTNSYGGGTMVAGGVLQVGANGGSGSLGGGSVSIATGTTIDFLRTGTLIVPGAVSGNGAVVNDGSGTVILANNNTYSGGTTINAGTLQVGNGGPTGSLLSSGSIVNDGLLVFNTSASFNHGPGAAGIISGTGNMIVRGGGFIKAIGNNTYSGWTLIDTNTTFQPLEGQDGALVSSVVTNNGTLRLVSQLTTFTYPGPIVGTGRLQIGANAVSGSIITLTGTNTYTGGTFIGGNQLALGDGITPGAGAIAGNVTFVNNFTLGQDSPRTLTFNRPDDFTFAGTITTNFASPQYNQGIVQQNGTGTLTLTGNNTYASGTVINAGTVQVGNGGTNGTIGSGPVQNAGRLVFNRSGSLSITGAVSGAGSVVQLGTGITTLWGNNNHTGTTTVSNGTLIITGNHKTSPIIVNGGTLGGTGVVGTVTIQSGGTLAPGTSIGTLTVSSNLNIGGNLVFEVNKSLAQSNDFVAVSGTLNNTGTGTSTVANLGPPLAIGDKFTLFSQPVQNGAALSVTGAGATWANNLAVDGSISVTAVSVPTLNYTWTGLNNGCWDTTTTNNWTQNGSPTVFVSNNGPVLFDDTAEGTTAVTVCAPVQPTAINVSNSAKAYSLVSSSGGTNTSGTTGLTKSGTGTLTLSGGANTYTGATTLNAGTLIVSALANGGSPSDIGASSSSALNLVLNGGRLRYTGGPVVSDRLFMLGAGGGTIEAANLGILNLNNGGSIVMSDSGSRVLTLTGNNNADNILAASISDSPAGGVTSLTKSGTGNWVLTGSNTYSGMTTIAAGVLIVGGSNGSLGSGDIVDNGALVFYRSGTLTVTSTISGTGPVIVNSGTVILSGNNTYSGYTAIYGGTLLINGNNAGASTEVFGVFGGTLGGSGTLAGPVTLNAGTTLAPGASIATLTINHNLSIGGNLAIEVNKSLSPSNDFVLVSGALTNTGTGTLTVSNLGPALAVGDKFTLFSEPVQNGAALTVTGAGATWANNLAADGSISVLSLVPAPILNYTNLGGTNLQFSWTGYFKLQSQTNNLDVGIGTNWGDYPGGGISGVTVPIDKTNESVFFRLAPVGQGQTLVYDQQSTTSDTAVPPLGATMYQQPMGQSFVPTFSSVGFVRFYFANVAVPGAVDATIHVNLWASAIGTGTLLGSTASVFLPVGFGGSTNFFFSPPVTANPGTTYYLETVAEVGSDNVNLGHSATGTAYTNGTAIFFGVPVPSYDLWFREGIVAP